MEKITKARAALVLSQPFFASLALRLRPLADPAIETMDTDGRSLFVNPDFVDRLSFDQLTGVIAHEVMHLACGHHARRGERDLRRWNMACDHAINGLLLEAGFVLPEGHSRDPAFDGLSAEDIYARLPQEDGGGDGSGGGGALDKPDAPSSADPGGCGGIRDAPGEDGGTASPDELAQAERDWKVATLQAAQIATAAGKLPGAMARMIEGLRKPSVDWREVLRRLVRTTARNDYAWFPPNRRYVAMGLYLPSLRSEEMGPVVIAVDTSGSISDDVVAAFSAEISAILEDCRPEAVHVLYCDREIAGSETLAPDDLPLRLDPKGGGGTDFRPPFEWVARQDLDPACMIYLTDLCSTRFPAAAPAYPLIWAATSEQPAPFGDIVRLSGT
ncbi:MAG: hypothetical protein GKS00_02045 [Alphaproteobacteria bacterium]|nr:hypothetical protein [Alphaproteobacteria bacterium]